MSAAMWWFSKNVPLRRRRSWPGSGTGQVGPMYCSWSVRMNRML